MGNDPYDIGAQAYLKVLRAAQTCRHCTMHRGDHAPIEDGERCLFDTTRFEPMSYSQYSDYCLAREGYAITPKL